MDILQASLPPLFRSVRYVGSLIPNGDHDLRAGANCQRYAYAVLAHFGLDLPPMRSSELWADCQLTVVVDTFEPLDLLLFSPSGDAFGAHVAVYAGAGQALHLSKSVGRPALWPLAAFSQCPAYRILLSGKRALPA